VGVVVARGVVRRRRVMMRRYMVVIFDVMRRDDNRKFSFCVNICLELVWFRYTMWGLGRN
jgi:hypothetical protein